MSIMSTIKPWNKPLTYVAERHWSTLMGSIRDFSSVSKSKIFLFFIVGTSIHPFSGNGWPYAIAAPAIPSACLKSQSLVLRDFLLFFLLFLIPVIVEYEYLVHGAEPKIISSS
jgi:hypothetical protein